MCFKNRFLMFGPYFFFSNLGIYIMSSFSLLKWCWYLILKYASFVSICDCFHEIKS